MGFMTNRKKTGCLLSLALVLSGCTSSAAAASTAAATQRPVPEQDSETATPEATLDPSVFTDTGSLLLLANKSHRLPEGYVPENLVAVDIPTTNSGVMMVSVANDALNEMAAAAAADGVTLKISSAYRSEEYQASLYNGYVASYGTEIADTISSRPGYSDHQTGLAADFVEGDGSLNGTNFSEEFEATASGQWLREHAHEYGFIMRYPKGKQEITGYAYEPWHFRYIGVEYATAIYETDVYESFEEYFGVTGGDYLE
jgi:LAS superfamily LD-carboxypeptidase LdcB